MQKKEKGTGIPRQRKDGYWAWQGVVDLPDGSTKKVNIARKDYDEFKE